MENNAPKKQHFILRLLLKKVRDFSLSEKFIVYLNGAP